MYADYSTWARVYDPDWDPDVDPPARVFCAWHCLRSGPAKPTDATQVPHRRNEESAACCLSDREDPPQKYLDFVAGIDPCTTNLSQFETMCESLRKR